MIINMLRVYYILFRGHAHQVGTFQCLILFQHDLLGQNINFVRGVIWDPYLFLSAFLFLQHHLHLQLNVNLQEIADCFQIAD